ncbi:peptide deformylase [bacterium]|nr:peptide deformylase [bacterium]
MAILKIKKYGENVLRQKSKEVTKISKKIQVLIENLVDTMYHNNGVGLAAPQVGENVRIFVIDVTEPNEAPDPIIFINPKIIKKEGAINSYEGCLSFPQMYTNVRRYESVKVKALNFNGKPFVIEARDGSLLARAIQHEFDHLDGILFVDHTRNVIETSMLLDKYNLPKLEEERLIQEDELEQEILERTPSDKEIAEKHLKEGKNDN